MSTYWGMHCSTCRVDSAEWWFNKGEHIILECIQAWPIVKQLDAYPDITVAVHQYESAPFDFLREHDGHVVIAMNEYGETP